MVLYILTGYWVLGIVYVDQLSGACQVLLNQLSPCKSLDWEAMESKGM